SLCLSFSLSRSFSHCPLLGAFLWLAAARRLALANALGDQRTRGPCAGARTIGGGGGRRRPPRVPARARRALPRRRCGGRARGVGRVPRGAPARAVRGGGAL